jgi:nucleotide-binding universal stress UspA family protein
MTRTSMKVLLAVDGSPCSEAAVEAVIEQYKSSSTEVRVLSVLEWPKGLSPALAFSEGSAAADHVLAVHEEERHRTRGIVERAACRLAQVGFQATTEVREGDARHEIVEAATAWGADAIVVGSHGRRRLERLVLGSVSEGVVRHAPCSVEVIRQPATIAG